MQLCPTPKPLFFPTCHALTFSLQVGTVMGGLFDQNKKNLQFTMSFKYHQDGNSSQIYLCRRASSRDGKPVLSCLPHITNFLLPPRVFPLQFSPSQLMAILCLQMLKPVTFFCSFPHAPHLICQQIRIAQSSKQTQPLLTTSIATILVHATRTSGLITYSLCPSLLFWSLFSIMQPE